MKNFVTILFSVALLIISNQGFACKCPPQSIDREVEKAYDIVVGKIISEKNEWVSCMYPEGDKEYEFTTSYTYILQTNFSYKDQLSGIQTIRGGKGKGDCGAIFEVGREYLIVVQRCDKGFYTTLCSDNAVLSEASTQIEFLNTYFGKDYKIRSGNSYKMIILVSTIAVITLILIVIGVYKSSSKRKA